MTVNKVYSLFFHLTWQKKKKKGDDRRKEETEMIDLSNTITYFEVIART